MRIQYCSDLHLEFALNNKYLIDNPLTVCGDILILAGDIVPLHDEFLSNSFFSYISDNYKQVFWVPGNHEFYYKDIAEFSKSYNIRLKTNINIVNNIDIEFEHTKFVFSTLWSKIGSANQKIVEQSVSDFKCITNKKRSFSSLDFNELHTEGLNFIKQSLTNKGDKTVVVTHHLPSFLCNSPRHRNSPINEAFCVDLTDYIEECKANFWLYGHSHFNQKPLYVEETILLTNQLGYVHWNEHGSFKHNAYFSV
ncbi:MAG: metallophosphoesterase [Bacteroidales bacterium]|nr:MAG: metallophosphoesterase [Bacteroidales bacterium]